MKATLTGDVLSMRPRFESETLVSADLDGLMAGGTGYAVYDLQAVEMIGAAILVFLDNDFHGALVVDLAGSIVTPNLIFKHGSWPNLRPLHILVDKLLQACPGILTIRGFVVE